MIEDARDTPTQIIEGDFDPAAGPTAFPGRLVITGDVPDQSEIQTNDGIEVHGTVGAAILRTHGDIVIRGGASGPGYLDAGRDMRLRFVENSTLVCGRHLIVKVSAMHSRLSVGQKILITSEKGVLVGGVAKAGMTISAARIGSPLYTRTELQVGIHPLLRSEHKRLTDRIDQVQQNLDGIQKNIEYLERLAPENSSERMAKRINKLPLMHLRVKHLSNELSKCVSRHNTLRKVIDGQAQQGQIDSIREVFPGVIVAIYWATLELREQLESVTFFEQGGEISWEPLHSVSTDNDSLVIEEV
ncbi:MAG: FapA family protein [Candidatus Poribacteria bacterium]|nr:FapA family protein [Candidatus Poribacteria bacterium]